MATAKIDEKVETSSRDGRFQKLRLIKMTPFFGELINLSIPFPLLRNKAGHLLRPSTNGAPRKPGIISLRRKYGPGIPPVHPDPVFALSPLLPLRASYLRTTVFLWGSPRSVALQSVRKGGPASKGGMPRQKIRGWDESRRISRTRGRLSADRYGLFSFKLAGGSLSSQFHSWEKITGAMSWSFSPSMRLMKV